MRKNRQSQAGFTLIEIAIALLVVSVLVGYSLALLPVQQDLKKSRQVDRELDEIIDQLVAFAQVNGRLPCPDTDQDGTEDLAAATTDGCTGPGGDGTGFFGFLPGRTLGMNGRFNAQGLLLDPWGTGYGYAVSNIDTSGGEVDLVAPNGVRNEGLGAVVADLFVCDDSTVLGDQVNCTPPSVGNEVVGNVAAVVISLGRDRGTTPSNIQTENTDDFFDGTNDKIYIISTRSDVAGAEFDDVVKWLSTNQLFSKMIEAGQLP